MRNTSPIGRGLAVRADEHAPRVGDLLQTAGLEALRSNPAMPPAIDCAIYSLTGKPFSAWPIAGCSRSFIGSLPNFACIVNQPSTAPGIVTGRQPCGGSSGAPLLALMSCCDVCPIGARPDASRP